MRRAELRRLVGGMRGAAFATDASGVVVAWGQGATKLLGYEAKRTLGRSCHSLFDGRDVFGNRYCMADCPILQSCRQGEPPRPHELTLRRADGSVGHYLCVAGQVTVDKAPAILYQVFDRWPRGPHEPAPSAPTASAPAPAREASPLDQLSRRERDVLGHLAQGLSTAEIAVTLRIQETTLRNHVQAILRKLGVHSKLEAVVLAFRHGLFS